jgi:hypothetical protein
MSNKITATFQGLGEVRVVARLPRTVVDYLFKAQDKNFLLS